MSIDAQRDAAESYIASQKGNGWVCLPEHYDDYGFSGGNLDRPALQRLKEDIIVGKIDMMKFVQSFSDPGTPYDNAVAESFFSIMKREELSHNWYSTVSELEKTVADFISFFNGYRPLQKLGNLTPNQYESRYWNAHK